MMPYSGGSSVIWAMGFCLFLNLEIYASGDTICEDGQRNYTMASVINKTAMRVEEDWKSIRTKSCIFILCTITYRLQKYTKTLTEVTPYNITKTRCCPNYAMVDGVCNQTQVAIPLTSENVHHTSTYIYVTVLVVVVIVIAVVVIIVFKRRKGTHDRGENDGYELPSVSANKSKGPEKDLASVKDTDKKQTRGEHESTANENIYEDDHPYEEVSCYEDLLQACPENIYEQMQPSKTK